jgi:hypothetical protein
MQPNDEQEDFSPLPLNNYQESAYRIGHAAHAGVSFFTDVNSAVMAEEALSPGQYDIRFYLERPLTAPELNNLKQSLGGVADVYQGQENGRWYLSARITRHPISGGAKAQWQLIIPLVIPLLTIGLIGIGIFKLSDITNNIGKILLIGGGIAIVLVALLRKPIEHMTEAATRKYL